MNGDTYTSRGGDRYGGGGHHSSSTRDYHTSDRRRDRDSRGGGDRGSEHRSDRGDRGDRDRGERRRDRSRSPGGHRRSRRDDDYYGSGGGGGAGSGGGSGGGSGADRDRYRERDGERYGGGGGGGRDRDFERERGGGGGDRGDRRRGGDRRAERSSRHDDARGSARGLAPQDPFSNRRRSATPPPKRKEPTPDLTDTVPITERKRRMTMWDIKPQGYENVTSEQAKLSGMFPLPGAPRQAPMDPTRLHAFMTQPTSVATTSALKPTNSRQAKRLLISGVPQGTDEETLLQFFNKLLSSLNVTTGGPDPIIMVQLNSDRSLGMLEFKNTNDATVCLALSGLEFGGSQLEIRRPKDYIVPVVFDDRVELLPGQISSTVPDSPNKILVSRIPDYLEDEQVIELLKSFGELKGFVLVKDTTDNLSKGIAFCEYLDPSATEIAVEGLGGVELGDSGFLKVQRASIGMRQAAGVEMGVNAMAMMAGTTSADLEVSRVLQLLNMVTPEELMDPEEYDEICEDIRDECQKFGKLVDIKVPRPSGGSRQTAGVGKIFVRFETLDSSQIALKSLAGRKFADRTVVCTYFSEENYEVSAF